MLLNYLLTIFLNNVYCCICPHENDNLVQGGTNSLSLSHSPTLPILIKHYKIISLSKSSEAVIKPAVFKSTQIC